MQPHSPASFRALGVFVLVLIGSSSRAIQAQCPHDWIRDDSFPDIVDVSRASIVFDDGTGEALYVGGHITRAGRAETNSVSRWNGSQWQAVGQQFADTVTAFGIYQGVLLAAGWDNFHASGAGRIVRWDGHAWHTIATLARSSPIYAAAAHAMVVYNDELYVAGEFGSIDGVPFSSIARWNGTKWSDVGGGISGYPPISSSINAMSIFHDELFVAGQFYFAGSLPAHDIARWNGSRWATLPLPLHESSSIESLCQFGDRLILGGHFRHATNSAIRGVAQWDGTTLSPVGSGLSPDVYTLNTFKGELYAGGAPPVYVQRFDGQSWSRAGDLNLNIVYSLATFRSELFASGGVYLAGHYVGCIRWNGVTWRSLRNTPIAWIIPRAVHHGELIGAGEFFLTTGELKFGLARWDGTAWQPFSVEAAQTIYPRSISSIVSSGDDLYVAGYFNSIGGVQAASIARFSGGQWYSLGAGLSNIYGTALVSDITLFQGELIAVGTFDTAGGAPAAFVARWDGTNWHPLGGGLPDMPLALTIYNGELCAGGGVFRFARWNGAAWEFPAVSWPMILSFRAVGPVVYAGEYESPDYLARVFSWDGKNSSIVGEFSSTNDDGGVPALGEYDGDLVASTTNPILAGKDVGYIARWNGSAWSAFGSGLPSPAMQIIQFEDSLFAAGNFGSAHWSPIGPAITEQPERQIARTGQQAAFAVSSAEATAFQWRHNGVALNDDAHISGATTANLTIDPVILGDAGQYDCVLTNACGNTTSVAAPLRVLATIPGKPSIQPAGQPSPG